MSQRLWLTWILACVMAIALNQPAVSLSQEVEDAESKLSPEESEPESKDAIFRSDVRSSFFSKGKVEASSVEEKKWIDDNCQWGMPKVQLGAGLGKLHLIVREGYVAGHSAEAKIPYWVCEHSEVAELSGPGDRDNSRFLPDPLLLGKPRAELSDYKGSGYDRGHMHPAGNAKLSQKMMDETHYLTNMLPQYGPTFNQGIWRHLESNVRKWTEKRGECWIISGPMFYDPLEEDETTADGLVPYFTIGDGEVAVPTHCYKIVLAKDENGDWETIAFMFENKRHASPHRLELHRTTIKWIEDRTGLDFFPELSEVAANVALKAKLENKKSEMWKGN